MGQGDSFEELIGRVDLLQLEAGNFLEVAGDSVEIAILAPS